MITAQQTFAGRMTPSIVHGFNESEAAYKQPLVDGGYITDTITIPLMKAIEKEAYSFSAGVMIGLGASYSDELTIHIHEKRDILTVTNGKVKAVVWQKFRKYKRVFK